MWHLELTHLSRFGDAVHRPVSSAVYCLLRTRAHGVLDLFSKASPGPYYNTNDNLVVTAWALRRPLRAMRPSLGASGAVLACFAADASYMPDNRVAFIFAPTVSFPISAGLKACLRAETCG